MLFQFLLGEESAEKLPSAGLILAMNQPVGKVLEDIASGMAGFGFVSWAGPIGHSVANCVRQFFIAVLPRH